MPNEEKATLLAADYSGAPITREEVKLLVDNYKKLVLPINNKPKTRSVWFSYEIIEDMFNQLKAEKDSGVGTDGLRIFFGTYPEKDLNDKPYDHPFQNTVIFVSTKRASNDQGEYHKNYFDHPEVFPIDPINRGELCEPNCNGVDEGLE